VLQGIEVFYARKWMTSNGFEFNANAKAPDIQFRSLFFVFAIVGLGKSP
jgi:hypothetical protein